jgi:hypothetical protein
VEHSQLHPIVIELINNCIHASEYP